VQGNPIRQMDPLFREIFEHHDAIELQIESVPSGVCVTETSSATISASHVGLQVAPRSSAAHMNGHRSGHDEDKTRRFV
jgi:hypothetical protein